ncbi:dUTP diphosphatase [Desulfobacterales bacterium HSG16]|nr:dUTP diphosphatase [Desulfobacterales bacterium HSG16]
MNNDYRIQSESPTILISRIRPDTDADIPLPCYMTAHSSGMDLHAAVNQPVSVDPGKVCLIPTGFAIALSPGFEAQIRPRSGLAVKCGIGLINSPGTIDADYRGEVMIPLINFGEKEFIVQRKSRIAQMVIQSVCRIQFQLVDKLDSTERNEGGFGHTGI